MSGAPTADADEERAAWLRLALTDGLGRAAVRRLLAAFGAAQAVLDAGPAAWREVVGAERSGLSALAAPTPEIQARLAAATAWLDGGADRHLLTLGETSYPAPLLQCQDPPLLLFAQGDPSRLDAQALAIVGSRNPTAQGLDHARAFARALSDAGLVIVSGLALGIDGAAHEGALEGAAGTTIAVVGNGLDRVYPARHRALAHRIAEQGLLLSEFAPGTPPLAPNFPQRNRIIAGLTAGTLVVEAALRSGSLVTARLAAEQGREVFAIPGSIHSPLSRGCHALIRQGAKLVESAQDVLEELGRPPGSVAAAAEPMAADPLLDALGHDPVTLDALSARTGWPVDRLAVRLLELELEGLLARLPGGLFQRRVPV